LMPEMDGFEVLENIRNTKKTKNIPVLILTAKDVSREDLFRLNAYNIQQIIKKGNIEIDDLIYKVKLMIENKPVIKSEHQTSNIKHNVLIVEDNPDNMITIKAILKNKYNIVEVYDGEKGLELAQSQIPDIILLDMSLPKMSGEEVVKNLKKNEETKNIPVIAVTAKVMKGEKEKVLKAGCDEYVPKPINSYELKEKISKLLKK